MSQANLGVWARQRERGAHLAPKVRRSRIGTYHQMGLSGKLGYQFAE